MGQDAGESEKGLRDSDLKMEQKSKLSYIGTRQQVLAGKKLR